MVFQILQAMIEEFLDVPYLRMSINQASLPKGLKLLVMKIPLNEINLGGLNL